MTANKDFKRLVRGRMQKTGESYTAARAQLINRPAPKPLAPSIAPVSAGVDYARLAGMSDASVKKATGCPWERWVKALDRVGADEWPHARITEYVREKYKTPDWWTQMVSVGYERIKGLRVHGQRRDGRYNISKSKVFAAPLGALYRAFSDGRVRARWLTDAAPVMRTATRNKSVRMSWPDGTYVAVGFYARGKAKTQVQVQHEKLPDSATAARMKEFWTARLAALEETLVA
jgi:uncharacterized protein YndB with AHSA1/START domain